MPRNSGKQTYIKLFPYNCLNGSIRWQYDSAERGCFYDLLCFAALCNTPGVISDNDGRAYPRSFIANRLNVSLDVLESTLKKGEGDERLHENDQGIEFLNWKEYQSEYARQKPYRQAKKKERDYEDVKKQNCFNLLYNIRRKELGRELDSAEIAKLRDDIDEMVDQGKSERETVEALSKKELHRK